MFLKKKNRNNPSHAHGPQVQCSRVNTFYDSTGLDQPVRLPEVGITIWLALMNSMLVCTFFLSNRFCSVSSKSGQTVSYFIFCHRNSAFYHDYSVILDQIPSLAQNIDYFIIVSMFKDFVSPWSELSSKQTKYTYLSIFNSVISMALSQGPLPYLARYLAVYNRLIQYLD